MTKFSQTNEIEVTEMRPKCYIRSELLNYIEVIFRKNSANFLDFTELIKNGEFLNLLEFSKNIVKKYLKFLQNPRKFYRKVREI